MKDRRGPGDPRPKIWVMGRYPPEVDDVIDRILKLPLARLAQLQDGLCEIWGEPPEGVGVREPRRSRPPTDQAAVALEEPSGG